MEEENITICVECGSTYLKQSSKMKSLCPECAHKLYGYPNCKHKLINGRCIYCYWNGKKSEYLS